MSWLEIIISKYSICSSNFFNSCTTSWNFSIVYLTSSVLKLFSWKTFFFKLSKNCFFYYFSLSDSARNRRSISPTPSERSTTLSPAGTTKHYLVWFFFIKQDSTCRYNKTFDNVGFETMITTFSFQSYSYQPIVSFIFETFLFPRLFRLSAITTIYWSASVNFDQFN